LELTKPTGESLDQPNQLAIVTRSSEQCEDVHRVFFAVRFASNWDIGLKVNAGSIRGILQK
jgi:hypothetical protein